MKARYWSKSGVSIWMNATKLVHINMFGPGSSVPIPMTGTVVHFLRYQWAHLKGVRVFEIKQSPWVIILTQTHVSLMLTHQIYVFSVGFQVKFCVTKNIPN